MTKRKVTFHPDVYLKTMTKRKVVFTPDDYVRRPYRRRASVRIYTTDYRLNDDTNHYIFMLIGLTMVGVCLCLLLFHVLPTILY